MPDPLDALRLPSLSIDPNPAFARELRDRLEHALTGQGEPAMSTTLEEPAGQPGVAPYLIVRDARRALDWYAAALGAHRRGDPMFMPDGRVGHAELELSGALIYLADESPEVNVSAPEPGEPARVSLTVLVPDVDAAFDTALHGGAVLESARRRP
jgi:uncharacterized glyoxalase superfamily protein PhnB